MRKKLTSMALILVGLTIFTFTVKLFLLPANLMSCGTTGIALLVEHFFHIPITAFTLVFNLVMLGVGWWLLGKNFALSTIVSSIYYPILLEILNRTMGDVVITENMLLNTLYSGMGMAIGLGLVIRGGASTGGMDIPPLVLHKYFRIPVSTTLTTVDTFIMLAQISFHPVEDLLYGILLNITINITLNKVTLFGTTRTEVKIISEHSQALCQSILSQVERGVTLLHGKNGYRQQETEVLLTVVSDREVVKIQRLAREIDPDCFIIISRVSEVWGRGFTYAKNGPRIEN